MIYGVGTDIIEIRRIENSIERFGQRFLDRVFTANERSYCLRHRDAARHFAGRFAAKEAAVKALGTGIREDVRWLDIEVVNDHYGKPQIVPSPQLKELIGNLRLHLSISHSHEHAVAFVICETG